jgi:hypothetical protein
VPIKSKPGEPISDARLQELIDEYTRRYVRLRDIREDEVYDTVKALTELKGMRTALARGVA